MAPARAQRGVLAAALALAVVILVLITGAGWRMPVLFALGIALGLTLYLTGFGFTSSYRELLVHRNVAAVKAQLVMVALATVLFAPVLAGGSVFGQPVAGALAPAGVPVAIGAFLFGLGMQLGGGCGSGTLYTAGGGSPRMLVVLAAFCAGGFWASLHMQWWDRLPAAPDVALSDLLGWPGAVALQLGVLAVLWLALGRVARRGARSTQDVPSFLAQRHFWLAGAIALALLNFSVLLAAGHPWTITWAFTLWGAKSARGLGWDPESAPFWSGDFQRTALEGGVLQDVTSVMDIGIMIGALAAAGLAARFRPQFTVPMRSLLAAVVGGLLMGYGARVAFGCNIGAFFSGVASTSLHGWMWIFAALAGTWFGIRMRPWFGLKN
ncbi:MAG: YeeE/YedE family protein [Betaproteobacteria bacterium]|nr:YeeE/YedE family protein [Betaproteobacteria bacterium]